MRLKHILIVCSIMLSVSMLMAQDQSGNGTSNQSLYRDPNEIYGDPSRVYGDPGNIYGGTSKQSLLSAGQDLGLAGTPNPTDGSGLGGTGSGTDVPVDGGIGFLLAAGLGYGAKRLRKKKAIPQQK